jgi:hypothetical protein
MRHNTARNLDAWSSWRRQLQPAQPRSHPQGGPAAPSRVTLAVPPDAAQQGGAWEARAAVLKAPNPGQPFAAPNLDTQEALDEEKGGWRGAALAAPARAAASSPPHTQHPVAFSDRAPDSLSSGGVSSRPGRNGYAHKAPGLGAKQPVDT